MNRNRIALIAVSFCAILGLFYIALRPPHIENYPPRSGPIIAFGDSLVAGVGVKEGKDFVSVLSESIGKPIENMGVPGDTITSGRARIATLLDRNPSIVILLLGGNDFLQRTSRDSAFENLEAIITQLQDEGTLVVLLGIRGGVLRDNYADQFNDLAARRSVVYVPNVLDGILGDPALMSDQIHPNEAGYARIAARVAKAIHPVLK